MNTRQPCLGIAPRLGAAIGLYLPLALGCLLVGGCVGPAELRTMQGVAEKIEQGKLTPDEHGVVHVAQAAERAAARQGVFVTGRADAPQYVLFVHWRGKGANLRGTLYSPKTALQVNDEVTVRGPIPLPQSPTAMHDVTVDARLAPGWYRVSRSLD